MANDQAKITTNELVNSTEFRRVVSVMVEDEINKLQAAHENIEGSILNEFAGEVSVTGLSDAIKAKNKILKVLWLLIFLGGLAAAAFFLFLVFEEYRNEPTATKVNIKREQTYDFPRIVFCVDTWLNAEKAMKLGLSKEGISYALHYLIPFEEVATEEIEDSKNISGLTEEFYRVYYENNYTSLADFFKDIALDAVANSKNEKELGFTCRSCVKVNELEKIIIDKTVCYSLFLKPVDGKLRQSYGLPEFEFRVPDMSMGILKKRAYWKLYVNPASTHLMSDTPYVSVYEQQAHSVRIKSEHYVMAPRQEDPCIEENDPNHPNYTSISCVIKCAWRAYREIYGCSVLNLDLNQTRPLEDYCNTYYWDQWPKSPVIDMKQMKKWRSSCIALVRSECSVWWYSTTVDAHFSNSLVKTAAKWNNRSDPKAIFMRSAKLYFINMDVLAGGVVTFREVFTYSFQTLVGNIGGTCGIWIGASVMTLIQLCMFFIEHTILKSKKPKKMNGTGKPEQTALV